MIRLTLLAIIMLLCIRSYSQPATFINHYSDSLHERGLKLVEDKQGNFLILLNTGLQWPFFQSLIKTDPYGNVLFKKDIDTAFGYFFDVTATFDSCYVLVGGKYGQDFAYKIDSNGDSVWAYNYPPVLPNDHGNLVSVNENLDHRLWVCGQNSIVTPICCRGYYFSIDSSGVRSNYASTGDGRGINVKHDIDSNIYIQYEIIPGNIIAAGLTKINRNGVTYFSKNFGGGLLPRLLLPLNGHDALWGNYPFGGYPATGLLIFKIDSAGNSSLIKNPNYPTLAITGLDFNCNNGYVLSGFTNVVPNDSFSNPVLYFLNDSLDSIGSVNYSLPEDDEIYSLIRTSDSAYAMTGATTSYGNGDWDVLFIKTDCNGGFTNIDETEIINDKLKVYPNPASTSFTIEDLNNIIQKVELLDVSGRVVQTSSLTTALKGAAFNTNKSFTITTENISDGIYLFLLKQTRVF